MSLPFIGESAAEKERKRAKRRAQQESADRAKRSEQSQAQDTGAAQKLALLESGSQGVLSEVSTGRRKLLGN